MKNKKKKIWKGMRDKWLFDALILTMMSYKVEIWGWKEQKKQRKYMIYEIDKSIYKMGNESRKRYTRIYDKRRNREG